jgi:hypothetical protein
MQCYITHNLDDLYLLKNINKPFSWVFLKLYNLHKDFFINEKTFMIYILYQYQNYAVVFLFYSYLKFLL